MTTIVLARVQFSTIVGSFLDVYGFFRAYKLPVQTACFSLSRISLKLWQMHMLAREIMGSSYLL